MSEWPEWLRQLKREEGARLVDLAAKNPRDKRWFSGTCLVCGCHPHPEVHGHGFECPFNAYRYEEARAK